MRVDVLLPFDGWKVECYEFKGRFVNGEVVVLEDGSYGILKGQSNYVGFCKKVRKADTVEVIDFWVTMDDYLLKLDLKIYNKAYDVYRSTKGNSKLDKELLTNKVKRNLLLAYKSNRVPVTDSNSIVFQYGFLRFVLYKDIVVHISKRDSIVKGWFKNPYTYDYYSKLLNVEGK